jgi:hypothetical protein
MRTIKLTADEAIDVLARALSLKHEVTERVYHATVNIERGLLPRVLSMEFEFRDDPQCAKCGQVGSGQTGEYPCGACGVPTLHDDASASTGESSATQ